AWRRVITPRYEAVLAIFVIAAAALLAAYPLPPARAGEAEEVGQRPGLSTALPQDDDLTLGGGSGDVLVGLTLRPSRPGANQALVYVLPIDGEATAPGISAELAASARTIPM